MFAIQEYIIGNYNSQPDGWPDGLFQPGHASDNARTRLQQHLGDELTSQRYMLKSDIIVIGLFDNDEFVPSLHELAKRMQQFSSIVINYSCTELSCLRRAALLVCVFNALFII